MIIIPYKFIFLETPRTGSKSCRAVLSKIPGATVSEKCHVGCNLAMAIKRATGLPLVTVTRDPLDHLVSWYLATANRKKPFVDFIEKGLPIGKLTERPGFDPFILNPYRDIADKVFWLERGLFNMFNRLGILVDEMPHINEHNKDLVEKDGKALFAASLYFVDDYAWQLTL